MERITARLEALRIERNLSYQEISNRSGVSPSTVRRIFNGESELRSLLNVRDILNAMGCSWVDLDPVRTMDNNSASKAAPTVVHVNGISEEEYQERLKPYLRHLDDLTRSRRLLFRCCCVLVIVILAILIFDLLSPEIGFVRR